MASILICEDERCISNLLVLSLETNHKITTAIDGVEGLQFYLNSQYDLVITDLTMPNMSGLELINKIKNLNPNIKIIALSALLYSEDIRKSTFDAGADICLTKPVNFSNLENIVDQLLNEDI